MEQELQIGADEVEAFVIDGKISWLMKLTLFGFPFGPCLILQIVILKAVVVSHAFPPLLFLLSSCSYQNGVLQNRPDTEESCREVGISIKQSSV